MFSAKMKYASMFMLDLAKASLQQSKDNPTKTLRLSDFSCFSIAPKSYIEDIVFNLKSHGLIYSLKGRNGGYLLAKNPSAISIADIAKAISGKVDIHECCLSDKCDSNCDSTSFFGAVDNYIDDYIENITLDQIVWRGKNKFIYLDCNASMPTLNKAKTAFIYGSELMNPSSAGKVGQIAKSMLEKSRKIISEAFGFCDGKVVFTQSGTAANNMLLQGLNDFVKIASSIEHSSILNCLSNQPKIKVNKNGVIDLLHLESLLNSHKGEKILVSVMMCNNETGVIQPVVEISKICKKMGALFHTDVTQACAKIVVNASAIGADFVTLSAHKIGSVRGTGILFIKNGIEFSPAIYGGGQEYGLFSGTENLASIYAFSVVVGDMENLLQKMKSLQVIKSYMELSIKSFSDNVKIIGEHSDRIPNTTLVCCKGIESSAQVITLDCHNISVGVGAACSYGRSDFSHVLFEMGIPLELSSCAIRISSGYNTSRQDIDKLVEVLRKMYTKVNDV